MPVTIPPDAITAYGDVHRTLEHILETVVAEFGTAEVDLPPRQYIAVGDVGSSTAWDCEQVTVNFVSSYFGTPGQQETQASNCQMMMSGDFVVQLVRCVPGPTKTRTSVSPPTAAAIEASTLVQAIDSQILLEAAYAVQSVQGRTALVAPSGVEGGFQGINLNLSVSLFRGV